MFTFYFFLALSSILLAAGNDGILFARNETKSPVIKSCIAYNPKFKALPSVLNESDVHPLKDLSEFYACNDTHLNDSMALSGAIVAVKRGNCTFSEKAEFVQEHGGIGVLIVMNNTLFSPSANNKTDYLRINITVMAIERDDFEKVQGLGRTVEIGMYVPVLEPFDPAIVIIFCLGMFCVIVGGWWSGRSRYQRYCTPKKKKKTKRKTKKSKSGKKEEHSDDDDDNDDDTLDLKPIHIFIFVVVICGMLLAMYFLYDYLVYVVIGMFALAGAMGLYSCCKPLWTKVFHCQTGFSVNKVPCCSGRIEFRYLILSLISVGFAVFWVVERHARYAWILQDIIGLAFCINMLKTVKLPSFKACTILLILLFFYDIFFVFITPLFTKNGDSIMVQVATGGNSKTNEQLPIVFKVPKLQSSDLTLCELPYSLLGFGDIIVPGLLIGYNYGFDLRVNSKGIYFISTVIAYAVGMIITFIALFLMESGQPALLYLVPCTLITTTVISCYRKELKHLWTGDLYSSKEKLEDKISSTDTTTPETRDTPSPTQPDSIQVEISSSSTISSIGNEDRHLLNR